MINRFLLLIFLTTGIIFLLADPVTAQKKMDRIERQTMLTILSTLKKDVKKRYYDPGYHGIDIEKRFTAAAKRLKEVRTTSQALVVIAQVFLDFDDSHLFFLPPVTNIDVEYGFRTLMIGEKCVVNTVRPKSDAEKQGLSPGDQLLSIEGFRPNRSNLWKIDYFFDILSKRKQLNLTVLKPGNESPRSIVVKSKIKTFSKVVTRTTLDQINSRDAVSPLETNLIFQFGNIAYWKLPSFGMRPANIDLFIDKVKKAESLIIDLRGNGGGAVVTLERLAGYIFDKDMILATPKGRKKLDVSKSRSKGDDVYKGQLIVLIDSKSASASEIFARIVQLQKRGIVLGDVSAGAVMMSRRFINGTRNDGIFYGASITIADVILPDGKSLEKTGVMPNARIVPRPADIAAKRDPVLAEAVRLLGGSITPEELGGMFRYDWRSDGSLIIRKAKAKK